jgi:hypothetical protein
MQNAFLAREVPSPSISRAGLVTLAPASTLLSWGHSLGQTRTAAYRRQAESWLAGDLLRSNGSAPDGETRSAATNGKTWVDGDGRNIKGRMAGNSERSTVQSCLAAPAFTVVLQAFWKASASASASSADELLGFSATWRRSCKLDLHGSGQYVRLLTTEAAN